jgi:hypothetical protein
MLSLLIYLPTIADVPHYTFILSLLYLFIKNFKTIFYGKIYSPKFSLNLLIILAIIGITIFYRILFFYKTTASDFFPYTVLLLLTYWIARSISEKEIRFLIILISIESLVTLLEYMYGVNTFLRYVNTYAQFPESEHLFYNRRTFGLSISSSIISGKLLLGFLLIDYLRMRRWVAWLIRLILIAGVVFTFNRTVISVLAVYFVLRLLIFLTKILEDMMILKTTRDRLMVIIFSSLIILAAGVLLYFYFDELFIQFTRGKTPAKVSELSGRDLIWEKFISFIRNNWLVGNGSFKYTIDYIGGTNVHAHNSFLQVMANNGIIVTLLYCILILINLNRRNLIFVGMIVLYSLTQYGIFWGISMMDVILFVFLFGKIPDHNRIVQIPSDGEKKSN